MTTHSFSDEQIESLLDNCSEQGAAEFLISVFKALDPEFGEKERVNPRDYVIPREQSIRLLDGFKARTGSGDLILLWMNQGPSSAT